MAIIGLFVVMVSCGSPSSSYFDNEVSPYVSSGVTLSHNEINNTTDFGFVTQKGIIGDFVWNDSDDDGIQDEGEDGLPGVNVSLYMLPDGKTEIFVNSTFSEINGDYSFEVPFGIYKVKAGEGQKYKVYCIKLDDPTIPERIRNFPWAKADELYAGDPKNDSNDHNGAIVILDKYNQINTTIDFGYTKFF